MVLKRQIGTTTTYTEATIRGFASAYRPQDLVGLVKQGDLKVVIGPSLGAIAPPLKKPDRIVIDGRAYVIEGATPRYVGTAIDGHELWVRGGA